MECHEIGKFQTGQSGNPAGRPKGAASGRTKALGALDRIIGSEENLAALESAMEEALHKRPLWFFINIVMPLLPKEAKGVLDTGGHIVEWRSLVSVCPPAATGKGNGGG